MAVANPYLRFATEQGPWGIVSPGSPAWTGLYGSNAAQPATTGPTQPAAGWRPSFLNTPRVDYPASPYAAAANATGGRSGMGGGRGGGFSVPMANAYNPTMFQGPGAYYPGHQAEFQGQQQGALMGIMAGRLQPDTRQPAQLAAAYARDAGRFRGPGQGYNRAAVGGGYGGGYGGGGAAGGLAGDWQRAYDNARQSNEARYRDVLEGYQDRYNRAMGYLQGAGAQEYADINERYDAQKAAGTQHLVGRGLGNSTLVNTMNMGVDRERTNDLGRLEERLRNQYLGYDTSLSGDTLGFMERRTDEYPSTEQLLQLAMLQGQGGVGSGGLGSPQGYLVSMATAPGYGLGGGYMPSYVGGGRSGVGSQTQAQMAAVRQWAQEANFQRELARLRLQQNNPAAIGPQMPWGPAGVLPGGALGQILGS